MSVSALHRKGDFCDQKKEWIYLIYPLPFANISTADLSKLSQKDMYQLMRDLMVGVSSLHQNRLGIGKIPLKSILITSKEPLRAVLSDFSQVSPLAGASNVDPHGLTISENTAKDILEIGRCLALIWSSEVFQLPKPKSIAACIEALQQTVSRNGEEAQVVADMITQMLIATPGNHLSLEDYLYSFGDYDSHTGIWKHEYSNNKSLTHSRGDSIDHVDDDTPRTHVAANEADHSRSSYEDNHNNLEVNTSVPAIDESEESEEDPDGNNLRNLRIDRYFLHNIQHPNGPQFTVSPSNPFTFYPGPG